MGNEHTAHAGIAARQIFAPELLGSSQRFITTSTGIQIGRCHVRKPLARHAQAIYGPYRRQRLRRIVRWAAARGLVFLLGAAVIVVASGMTGCSLASDSQIEELMALELADAIAQASNPDF